MLLREGEKIEKLGVALVHGYQLIDNELVVPKVRADIGGVWSFDLSLGAFPLPLGIAITMLKISVDS